MNLGRHLLAEYYNCDRLLLDDHARVKDELLKAADRAGATIVDAVFHKFNPHGVSGVVVIAESHLAIHTWPEYGYASVDVYTCGEEVDPLAIHTILERSFDCQSSEIQMIPRGDMAKIQAARAA